MQAKLTRLPSSLSSHNATSIACLNTMRTISPLKTHGITNYPTFILFLNMIKISSGLIAAPIHGGPLHKRMRSRSPPRPCTWQIDANGHRCKCLATGSCRTMERVAFQPIERSHQERHMGWCKHVCTYVILYSAESYVDPWHKTTVLTIDASSCEPWGVLVTIYTHISFHPENALVLTKAS